MTEEDLFEKWWSKHQEEIWELTLTAQERAAGISRSLMWGSAFKKDAKLAWMARAALND